jgi:hypothetical protein
LYDFSGVGTVSYGDLQTAAGIRRFIEDDFVPADSVQVGTTWRFVNKRGGPDRRFNNNRQLPIMQYGELSLRSSSGLNELFQCSVPAVGDQVASAMIPLFAGLTNIIPLLALISLWAHFPRLGAWLLLFLAVPLAIGGYSHFLSPGSDNVFRMADGELTFAFRISAVLLFVLEFLGCWLSIRILRRSSLSIASAQS